MISLLSKTELDLRFVFTGQIRTEEFEALLPRLQSSELAKLNRFSRFRDQVQFATGRALLRSMIDAYAMEPVGGWRLEQNGCGKPELMQGTACADLRFNISHCEDLVAVVLGVGRDVGIDVEKVDTRLDPIALSRFCFSASERKSLEAMSPDEQTSAFCDLWCLMEAYVKARGKGLAIPFCDFEFTRDSSGVRFSSPSTGDGGRWFFAQPFLSGRHVCAVCASREPEEDLTVSVKEVQLSTLLPQGWQLTPSNAERTDVINQSNNLYS